LPQNIWDSLFYLPNNGSLMADLTVKLQHNSPDDQAGSSMDPFFHGILAGYGIAIPVGAIAILIVEAGLRRGFWTGFAAGAGAATADLVYATLAALAGQTLAALLAPYADGLRFLSVAVLLALGAWGIAQVVRARWGQKAAGFTAPANIEGRPYGRTYLQFVSLTLLNPMTVAYFAALILGGGSELPTWMARFSFVAGAALASLSWQSLLAGVGALAHRHMTPKFQWMASLAGNLIVMALGVRMLMR
jgi:arginine exporter protein ArgO